MDVAADDQPHHFGASRQDPIDARVGEHAADRILIHIACAAVQLYAEVEHLPLDFRRHHLGLGAHIAGQPPRIVLGDAVIDIDLHEIDLGIHLRHAELGVLLFGQRPAE